MGLEGILIQGGDPWIMAGAILELFTNRKSAVTYGQNARVRAIKRHDPGIIINNLVSIYNTIQNKST